MVDERADLSKPCSDKVALLVGNRNFYERKLTLNTPENDTQDLAGILRSADFKVVSLVNLTKLEMEQVRVWPLAVWQLCVCLCVCVRACARARVCVCVEREN